MAYTLDDLTDLPSGVYNRLKQKFVNLTKPDTEFADLPYEAQATSIDRRQKLADLLQQQARSPIEIQSYKGIQAPIATTAGLAKVLDSIMAGYEEGDTATQAKASAKAQEEEAKYTLGQVDKATSDAYRTTPVTSGTLADIPGANTATGDITAMPAGTTMPDTSGYDAQAEMANIPSAFGNRQPLDSGYTGLSGQSVQRGSRQDLAKALLGSRISSLRNAGLAIASEKPDPEKLYEIGRGGKLVTGTGEVRGVGVPPEENEAPKTTGGLQWNGETKKWEEIPGYTKQQEAIARARRPDVIGSGPFGGRSLPAQFMNTVITGNPSSPEYAFAYNSLSKPRVTVDPDTMQPITIPGMDMSQFSKPTGPVAPGATGTTPTVGSAIGETKGIKEAKVTLQVFDNQLKILEQDLKKPTLAEKSLYATTGVSKGGMASALGSYNAMVTISRDPVLINTGVLQPAELKYMNGFLNNPGTIKGMLSGDKSTIEAFNKLRNIVSSRLKAKQEVYGTGPAAPGAGGTTPAPSTTIRFEDMR